MKYVEVKLTEDQREKLISVLCVNYDFEINGAQKGFLDRIIKKLAKTRESSES